MTDSRAGATLRFEILGEVRVLRHGEPIDLGPAKQRAVLAVLLLQPGRPVPTHQIVDAVWGDEPPENGANVVQKYVAGLRRVLDPHRAPRTPGELLALTPAGYVLRATAAPAAFEGAVDASVAASVDAADFHATLAAAEVDRKAGRLPEASERFRSALALWRGEALAGLGGPVFETARTRLAEARATAWERWSEIELTRGHQTALIPELARLVGEFPVREGLRAQLMVALAQAGRQGEALATFRDARQYFLDEFGAEPGERLQEAHRRVLQGDFFYTRPVDPWAGSEPTSSVSSDVAGHPPAPAPPVGADHGPAAPPSPVAHAHAVGHYWPPGVPALPPAPVDPILSTLTPTRLTRLKSPVGEIICAFLAPFLLCGVGNWVYFVYAAAHHRDRRQYIAAGVYATLLVVAIVLAFFTGSMDDSGGGGGGGTEDIGMPILLLAPFLAAVHGALLAMYLGRNDRDWILRETARQLVRFEPARARQAGVGRPLLLRGFSDGGLVDINHASAAELCMLPGVTTQTAQRIVTERSQNGPFSQIDDLAERGLLPARAVHRIAGRLVCVLADPLAPWPPQQQLRHPGWLPPVG